jgi:hypothetical protein
VIVAGVIWIIYGSILLLYLIVWFIPRISGAIELQRLGSLILTTLPGSLVGAALVLRGVWIILGRARDFSWIAIGSIALALLIGASGALMILIQIADFGFGPGAISTIMGLILGPGGLFAAGVLALIGQPAYLEWRKSHESRARGN